ncbi:hypothetical protein [Hymenobacter sp. DG01]|uniref:hypothetical protein n=1 Tax=Hymenobacter sp. DG01 TaxID=2584940 RepID=UPI0015DDEFF6|nr:hypothetical protein [Hymenobacter sp. DG01]
MRLLYSLGVICAISLVNAAPVRAQAQIQVQLEQELDYVRLLPDSLDQNSGPALVLPSASWSSAQKQLPVDKGVVYGSCVQRLGGTRSGGLGQYIRLVNLDTGKYFRLSIKPILRSRRENTFCYALPPGRYALINYEFSDSKWYGAELHVESVRKHRNSQVLANTRYVFEVRPSQLHYVGTWDLSQEFDPRFLDEKFTIDLDFTKAYPFLPVESAQTILPK